MGSLSTTQGITHKHTHSHLHDHLSIQDQFILYQVLQDQTTLEDSTAFQIDVQEAVVVTAAGVVQEVVVAIDMVE